MLPLTRKACGFTTLNDVNGKGYVPEFYTNDIENVNSQIKFWVNEKLPLDVFIQKIKDLIECNERQYIDAISEREILNLLKNSNTSKLEVRDFQWLPKEQAIDICNRYRILKFPVVGIFRNSLICGTDFRYFVAV